uniref:Uncharacterized protein n=1 Tax=Meloidogyne incognita TaxID=6306 RepID=A0A914M014_MELIC
MEEVVERRKWLFTRRKSSKGGSAGVRLRRRPTLSHFLAECEKQRRRDSGPPISGFSSHFTQNVPDKEDLMSTSLNDPNFRLQQKYWGKIHRKTPTPSPSPDFGNSDEDNTSSRSEEEEEEEENSIDDDESENGRENIGKEGEEGEEKELNKNNKSDKINESIVRNRRGIYLRQRERERPLSDGALLPEQEILMKISVSDAHRPKRDERGRRLGGEWDKRFERLGKQLVAKLNERGENIHDKNEEKEEGKGGGNERYPSLPSCSSNTPTTKKTFSQSTRSRQSSKSRKSHKYRGSNRGSSKRRRKRRERRFSEPNLGTLERFEKPTNAPMPLLMPVEKPVGNKKLTFMISEIMATGASQQQLEAEVRLCCIIQVKMWPIENKVPLSTTALIEVLKMTRSWRKRAPDRPESRPTIVMSHNGVSRCGIFIAANVLIDQMEMDHEVDVFHAVKLIRLNRPQLIDGPRTRFTGDAKDEYKYLYDLMLHWYMTNPELRSFEPPEADSLGSDDGSSDESIGESQSLGTNRRSIRSGNTRSIQRSKSSRASRRTITTANSLVHGGTEIGGTTTQRNSNETSNEQKKRMEPVYLN